MKALEILKNLKNEMQSNDGIINWDCSYEYFKKVNNAIKELEDLQNRSCENCKFLDIDLICTNLTTPCYSEYSGKYDNFGCSEWKSK